MIRVYDTLYELAVAIGIIWPQDMPDRTSPKKFRVADTDDECWRVHNDGTRARKLNTETLDTWINDFNTPRWSPELDCMVTRAHYNRNDNPTLRGKPESPERLAYHIRWRDHNQDKVQANIARNSTLPDNKQKVKERNHALYASKWEIPYDITLQASWENSKPHVFKAKTPYKWSTLVNYYQGSGGQTSAIADGWIKVG